MTKQGRKLMTMIGTAVANLNNMDAIVPAVQDLGRRHKTYGVLPEHYGTVATALLWTLGQGLGDAFTPQVEAAWTAAYTILATPCGPDFCPGTRAPGPVPRNRCPETHHCAGRTPPNRFAAATLPVAMPA